jgi:ADP-ribose pyrophosphatase YjhB (NUDIX family)
MRAGSSASRAPRFHEDSRMTTDVVPSREYPARPIVGVGGVVLIEGRVVLVRRRHAPLAGRWSLPGGGLELGETLRDAVRRELLEETGLVVEVGAVIDVFEHIDRDADGRVRHHFVIADYFCHHRGGTLAAGGDAGAVALADPGGLEPYALTADATSVVRRALARYGTAARPSPAE